MHIQSPRHVRGASLVELVAALGIVAIVVSTCLPSFAQLMSNSTMTASQNRWMTILAQARGSAVMRERNVVICPASFGECIPSVYWHGGWIMFEDENRNARHDDGETLILRDDGGGSVHVASSTGRQHIRYLPDGSSAGSNVTLTLCDKRGAAHARAIVINNAGRPRAGIVDPAYAAVACSAF